MEGKMKLARYLGAIGLSIVLALPVLAQTASPSKSPGPAATAPGAPSLPAPSATANAPAKPAAGELLDINSATSEELDKLPGVGPARAKAIIAHRPYNGKDDLVNRKIIPSNVYAQIKDKIIARQK
jgi:DNA uptake protein ComE-like DNA-binding protein